MRLSVKRRHFVQGLTIVEMMVGLFIALFICLAAMTMFTSQVINARKVAIESRVNQDLQHAVNLIARDLRRAGYWGNAIKGTVNQEAGTLAQNNPYEGIVFDTTAKVVTWSFSQDSVENDQLDTYEQFGFRLIDGKLQFRTDLNTWQDVTDKTSIIMTGISVTQTTTTEPLGTECLKSCGSSCPSVLVRTYDITLNVRSAVDANITRTASTRVRMRNDTIVGSCPAA